MKVSLIIPIYNVEAYVVECMDSVINQTHNDLEVILVDDASTDGSLQALRPYLSDPRMKLVKHERNLGLSAARNTGFNVSSGKYVIFVDSDDVLSPGLVATCLLVQKYSGANIVTFDFCPFRDRVPSFNDKEIDWRLVEPGDATRFAPPFFAWLKMIDRCWMERESIKFREGELYEDHRFHWLIAATDAPIAYLTSKLYGYRIRPNSITADPNKAAIRLAILDELVTSKDARIDENAREVGERTIIQGGINVLATCSSGTLRNAVNTVSDYCARIGRRRPHWRPEGLRERVLFSIGRHNNRYTRTALFLGVWLGRSIRRLDRVSAK
ncbi:glycosyltransferase family 2 protein [Sphingomonas edaphi]|uniref:Glycosyltransferase family 2 protein n=1 Tax=Sphingomonas edaphi TaxID=2315689 RepID=A0A418PYE3_9SPHN|nr:glycosyltransferase family 2 protein [Sphingomonas edaphi]RIX27018.1 glycosyltransferase family 2 protein [Sphingomonas edaphi]